jgi:hypothetical protein
VLLSRGLKVRGATRSAEKGKAMLAARPEFASKLDFVQIQDFEKTGIFDDAIKNVDAVIHVASVCFIPKIIENPLNLKPVADYLRSHSLTTPKTMKKNSLSLLSMEFDQSLTPQLRVT